MVKFTCNVEFLKSPSAILKIFELMCVSVSIGIFRGVPITFGDVNVEEWLVYIGSDADFFSGGVLVTCLIFTPVLFFLYICGYVQIQRTVLEMGINFLLASFLFIAGSVGLSFWAHPPDGWERQKSEGMAMSIFCYIAAVFYTLDFLWSSKLYCCRPKEEETEAQVTA